MKCIARIRIINFSVSSYFLPPRYKIFSALLLKGSFVPKMNTEGYLEPAVNTERGTINQISVLPESSTTPLR